MQTSRKNIRLLWHLAALMLVVVVLSHQWFGTVPPLGKILDPFTGFVQNEKDVLTQTRRLDIGGQGLHDSVNIFFDDRQVPHIYAKNEQDLFFAQGYTTAYFRLWQMDFLSYTAAGRLSEIFGEQYLAYDRNQRRIGLLQAAINSAKLIEGNAETNAMITAYTKGVNAYIAQLSDKGMPIEYKLFDYAPEPWTNVKTVLIMKHMAAALSGYEEDLGMTNLMLALGEPAFNKLFPGSPVHTTPVVNFPSKKVCSSLLYTQKPAYLENLFRSSDAVLPENPYHPETGSNSWVVSGKKTRSGFPILCSDPHLQLTLPSCWLEMQLVSPAMNVYGVSIPGIPAIIIGFNENIAWGTTNGNDDARDWYQLNINETTKQYLFDGKWRNLQPVVETISIKGSRVLYDTVYYTVHGPVTADNQFPVPATQLLHHALHWGLHRPSNELLTYLQLNKAKDYHDFKEALHSYASPIQNFTFAGKDNSIAIHHQGNLPVKWPGQGKFILDGTRSDHLYHRTIPADSLPHLVNPSCNYVIAANQHPTDNGYTYYYNGYYRESRANRIGQLLVPDNRLDLQKMQSIQLDNTSSFANDALPVLLNILPQKKLSGDEQALFTTLHSWQGTYDLHDEKAKLFQLWWKYIKEYTWDELAEEGFQSKQPLDYILLQLISREPGNEFFDRKNTAVREQAADIISEAFSMAVAELDRIRSFSSIQWGANNKVNIRNLANIGVFNRMNIASAGYPEAINAISNNMGPSWRMIVELGERPKAFGIYPGGQSGNGGSRGFDLFVNDWNKGRYYPLQFYMSTTEARAQSINTWSLR